MPRLTSYGIREWGAISLIALTLIALVFLFLPPVWWWAALPLAIAWIGLVAFFRDPPRRVPDEASLAPGSMISPADGVISAIEVVEAHDATGGQPAWVLRIFLSVLDVHVNRMPCRATVVREVYRPGRFHDARTGASARENENNLIVLTTVTGESFGVRQIAGLIARRIVSRLTAGQIVERGERFGMLKFGSSTELILPRPEAVRCELKVGDRVWGGVTVLAVLPPLGDAPSSQYEHSG